MTTEPSRDPDSPGSGMPQQGTSRNREAADGRDRAGETGRRREAPAPSGRRREPGGPPGGRARLTRAAAAWTAVVAALAVFILLVVFFIQNQDTAVVHFLGLTGPVPLGIALFVAAVAGGVLVAVAGTVRIIQLRSIARRQDRRPEDEA